MNSFLSFQQQFFQSYKFGLYIGLLALSVLSFQVDLRADHSDAYTSNYFDHLEQELSDATTLRDATALGLTLETRFWTLVQNQKVEKFSKKIAHIFQGLNIQGIYTREEQITGLTGATLTSFEIQNPKGTRSGNTIVFSYEFIIGAGSSLTPGPDISIWKKHGDSWKIVSHSYVPFLP